MSSDSKALPSTPAEAAPPTASNSSQARTAAVHDTAHVADKASLVTRSHALSIGAQCVLHPFAKVDASHGPVSVGEQCVLWEKTTVGAAPADSAPVSDATRATELGKLVVVSPHAVVEAGARIGDGAVLGPLSRVGAGARIGARTTVAATAVIPPDAEIPDSAVVGAEGRVIRLRKMDHAGQTVRADLEKAREIKDVGEARHRALMRKLVKGQAGGTGRAA